MLHRVATCMHLAPLAGIGEACPSSHLRSVLPFASDPLHVHPKESSIITLFTNSLALSLLSPGPSPDCKGSYSSTYYLNTTRKPHRCPGQELEVWHLSVSGWRPPSLPQPSLGTSSFPFLHRQTWELSSPPPTCSCHFSICRSFSSTVSLKAGSSGLLSTSPTAAQPPVLLSAPCHSPKPLPDPFLGPPPQKICCLGALSVAWIPSLSFRASLHP